MKRFLAAASVFLGVFVGVAVLLLSACLLAFIAMLIIGVTPTPDLAVGIAFVYWMVAAPLAFIASTVCAVSNKFFWEFDV